MGNRKSYDHRLLYFREEGGRGIVGNCNPYVHRLLHFREEGGKWTGMFG